jgi:hypothetical protein
MSYRHFVAPLVLLFAAGIASAHGSLPNEQWCAHGQTAITAHVSFTLDQIRNFADCLPVAACTVTDEPLLAGRSGAPLEECSQVLVPEPSSSCGVFDDDYELVRQLTDTYCHGYTKYSTAMHVPDWGTVVANLLGQDADIFYDADDDVHHEFVIGQSIELVCLRCEDPVVPMQ